MSSSRHAHHFAKDTIAHVTKGGNANRHKLPPALHHDVVSHHISVKDLIDAGTIQVGDQVWFKEQTGTFTSAVGR